MSTASGSAQLQPGEKILWSGQSHIPFFQFVRSRFQVSLLYIVPFVLASAYVLVQRIPIPILAAAFPIIIGIFLAIALPVIAVMLIVKLIQLYREYRIEKRPSHYAVTTQRILIGENAAQRSIPIAPPPGMTKIPHYEDIGSIQFQVFGSPAFHYIQDVDGVYQLINKVGNAQKT